MKPWELQTGTYRLTRDVSQPNPDMRSKSRGYATGMEGPHTFPAGTRFYIERGADKEEGSRNLGWDWIRIDEGGLGNWINFYVQSDKKHSTLDVYEDADDKPVKGERRPYWRLIIEALERDDSVEAALEHFETIHRGSCMDVLLLLLERGKVFPRDVTDAVAEVMRRDNEELEK